MLIMFVVLFTGIACLLNRINVPRVSVAVDGSLYRFHPHFPQLMQDKTKILVKSDMKVRCYQLFVFGDLVKLCVMSNVQYVYVIEISYHNQKTASEFI